MKIKCLNCDMVLLIDKSSYSYVFCFLFSIEATDRHREVG